MPGLFGGCVHCAHCFFAKKAKHWTESWDVSLEFRSSRSLKYISSEILTCSWVLGRLDLGLLPFHFCARTRTGEMSPTGKLSLSTVVCSWCVFSQAFVFVSTKQNANPTEDRKPPAVRSKPEPMRGREHSVWKSHPFKVPQRNWPKTIFFPVYGCVRSDCSWFLFFLLNTAGKKVEWRINQL